MVMGIPGLLAISFIDSAGVPLVGGPDTVILLLAWRRPAMAPLIVLAAAIGSLLGCLVLYGIGRKGGEKAMARFKPERRARVERMMQEYGIWAIIASVIAPPPVKRRMASAKRGAADRTRTRASSMSRATRNGGTVSVTKIMARSD